MKIDAGMNICRSTGGGVPPEIRIRIRDTDARVEFVELTMTLADFASAVTGLDVYHGMTAEVRGLDRVGTIAENKTELVPYDKYASLQATNDERDAAEDAALAPYEVDGWRAGRGSSGDLRNQHRLETVEGMRCMRVAFFRNVPRPDMEEKA